METVTIDGRSLTIEQLVAIAASWANPGRLMVQIAPATRQRMGRAREAVLELFARGAVVYGVTTGFGRFKDQVIPHDKARELQRNLILSHSVGVGEPLDEGTVRAIMCLRVNALAQGYSGIRADVLDLLVKMLNRGVHPVIPSKGSVGASGDLAPLAHMALVCIGEGEAIHLGQRMPGAEALRQAGLDPLELDVKEGVALINGTAVMAAIGALAVYQAEQLTMVADIAGALTLEALGGTRDAFDERIHALRHHPHQMACAEHFRRLLEGSELTTSRNPNRVQDAYSLRCMPQVHGAVRDIVAYGREVIQREVNAAIDNPLLFWEEGQPVALSGGNFHGEPLALTMDYLGIAMSDLGNMAERRLARLLDPACNHGLPAFLVKEGGLNSGFMLTQYTAAALASENKILAHPASVDTIPTSANAEDHVSMGTIAARKAREILQNVTTILALELMAAAQAVEFRRVGTSLQLGKGTTPAYEAIRSRVPFIAQDTSMYPHIEAARALVQGGELTAAVQNALRLPPPPTVTCAGR